MKHVLICGVVVGWIGISMAQVSSHTSTKFAVPSTQLTAPVGKAVAKVNGTVLTDRDLLREEYAIFPYARQHSGSIPQAMEPGIRKGALEMIIFEELAYQDAKKQKMMVAPEKLTQSVREFRKRFSTVEEYQQLLKSDFAGSEGLLRKRIERSLLIDQYLSANVTKKAAVSDAELKAYYDNNGDRYTYGEKYAIQTISIMPPANASSTQLQDARKRADDALRQAKSTKTPEEFGLLAEKVSEDDYRVMMGDHKFVERDKIPPEMMNAISKMKHGEISDLIQVGQYYVVFRLNGHVAPGKFKFAEVKDDLRKELQQKKTEHLRSALNTKLRQGAKVETL